MTEIRRITAQEFVGNTAEVLQQAAAGETFAIVEDGYAIAILHAVDHEELKFRELVKAGIISPDIVAQQREVLERLRTTRTQLEPGSESASETIIRMRREERT